ncbi:MAG: hypothetical protein R8M14_02085 [Ghiorsea sp.]
MNESNELKIRLDDKKIISWLFLTMLSIELLLVLLDGFVNYGKFTDIGPIRRLFNIAREDGMATLVASTQTLFAGLTAMLVYSVSKKMGKVKKQTMGWLITALFFIYMGIDDGSQVHERVGSAFKIMAERNDGGLISLLLHLSPSYPWQLIFLPIFGGIGLYMTYFLWRELKDSDSRKLVFLALAFMATAVVLDFIEGLDKSHPLNIYTYLRNYFEVSSYTVSHFAKVMEEFLEMLSISTFWVVFTKHFLYLMKSTNLKVQLAI